MGKVKEYFSYFKEKRKNLTSASGAEPIIGHHGQRIKWDNAAALCTA